MEVTDSTLVAKDCRNIPCVLRLPCLSGPRAAENIRYGRPDASEEEVEAAARAANAHTFISALPEQYSTKVRGRLCGGCMGGKR